MDFNWFLEEARMDLKHNHSTIAAIIMDPLWLLLYQQWAKYLVAILISLGRIMGDGKMEMGILLFSLLEMILILSNLNVWINKEKFFFIKNIIWLVLVLVQMDSEYIMTAISKQVFLI
jgi:hypothetical protein